MSSSIKRSLLAVGSASFLLVSGLAGSAQAQNQPANSSGCQAGDSAAVTLIASRFHRILSTGDTAGIDSLLAPDLRVIEGGTVETRREYLSHHLSEDIEFTRGTKEERSPVSYKCEGNVVWLVSTSTSTGKFKGREIDSVGAELMILGRARKGWQIRAIHWSSARRQPR